MVQFNFEPINFGLGAASGVLTTVVVQRVYRYVRNLNLQGERALVRTYASREADRRYLLSLVEYARSAHLLGNHVSLADILIEPRFLPPTSLVELPEDDVPMEDVFEPIPRIHDYPYMYAPYNIRTISIDDLSRGSNRVIIVGNPGSGRTTALLAIALWSSGYLEFIPDRDEIIADLEAELDPKKDVPLKEQELRIRRRVAMAEVTRRKYREEEEVEEDKRPQDPTKDSPTVPIEVPPRFRDLAPLYVHMADVVLDSGEYGQEIDPSEPLIRALQRQSGWLTSKTLVNKTYRLLEQGNALVLIDGYDDIPAHRRPYALRWIRALMEFYPDNFFITTMPPEGYGLLMEIGAVPVYLRPWHDQNISDSMDKIQQQWDVISKKPIDYATDEYETIEEYIDTLKGGTRQLSALELTLRTFALYRGLEDAGFSERMQVYLEDLYPDANSIMPELQRLATIQLDKGYITVDNLVNYALQKQASGVDPELSATITSEASVVDDSTNGDAESGDETSSDDKQRRQLESQQARLLDRLVKAGVVLAYRGGRYQFRHKILASYLAARDLVEAREDVIYRKFLKQDWEYAMYFLAEMRDVDFLVAEQLDNAIDVRHEAILKLTDWLKYAGTEVSWRSNLLRYLGNLLAAPNQFTLVRERVAAALVGSRDEGATIVFRRSLGTPNGDVRKLSALALGALQDAGAIEALTKVVLQDQLLENRIVAIMALIAIGSEDALVAAIDLLDMAENEEVRRAVTENIAMNKEFGYLTLRDMASSDSIAMRRAAIYGIARVDTLWSWILIDRIFQKDTESFVRLASEVVSRQKFDRYFYELQPYPEPVDIPWFVDWAEFQKQEGYIPYDMSLEQALDYAFTQKEDADVRWLMTGTIGQLGQYEMLEQVYQALEDRDYFIRDRAYRTLGQFQEKLGKPLPAPVSRD